MPGGCVVLCFALLALTAAAAAAAAAAECPGGGRCGQSQTCCRDPVNGFECCPLEQGSCCDDDMHCCPAGTICNLAQSSCVNTSISVPWVERISADQPSPSKSFRMIKTYMGEEDENVCPDQSRCPAEFSCLRASTGFRCCPIIQGVPCPDAKHCCPGDHQCTADSYSCIRKEAATVVLCDGGASECPGQTTCCEGPEGQWGCCPMPKAVCCEDQLHCCPDGSTCNIQNSKCISSSTKEDLPMWSKLPARTRAEWENKRGEDEVRTAEPAEDDTTEKVPEVDTDSTVPPLQEEAPVTQQTPDNDKPCSETCPEGTTCCESKDGGWNCCPQQEQQDTQEGEVACDYATACPEGNTCCKTEDGRWSCCPLYKAVCCDDHRHCCPFDTTCQPASLTCLGVDGPTPMKEKIPALTTAAPTTNAAPTMSQETQKVEAETEEATTPPPPPPPPPPMEQEEQQQEEGQIKDGVKCDDQASCPLHTTCCFIVASQKWGCCPLPEAVCCKDGEHCCPAHYTCNEVAMTCTREAEVIPWYTKVPANDATTSTTPSSTTSVQADPSSVQCGAVYQCPESTTCCLLVTGGWGCCPFPNAVCCSDMEHCCPEGYTCNLNTKSCHKVIMLQLDTVPLTLVLLPESRPPPAPVAHLDVHCRDQTVCKDGMTCCKTSDTTWGCCPLPNAVCCSDMKHCCPTGYVCAEGGLCHQSRGHHWDMFLSNRKRTLIEAKGQS